MERRCLHRLHAVSVQDPPNRSSEFANRCRCGRIGRGFAVGTIDEDGRDAGGATRGDVFPPVADEIRALHVDSVLARSSAKQAGQRLAAVAAVGIIVRAHVESVERQFRREPRVHGLDAGRRARAAGDVRLVRDDEQHESGVAQCLQRRFRVVRDA